MKRQRRGPYKRDRMGLTRGDPFTPERMQDSYAEVRGNLAIPDADHIATLTQFANAVHALAYQAQEDWEAYERQLRMNQARQAFIRALEAELRPLRTQDHTVSHDAPPVQRVAQIDKRTFRPGRLRKPYTPENMAVRGAMQPIADEIAWLRSRITPARKPKVHGYAVFKAQLLDLIQDGLQRANPEQHIGRSKDGPVVRLATLIIPAMTGEMPTTKSVGTHSKKPKQKR